MKSVQLKYIMFSVKYVLLTLIISISIFAKMSTEQIDNDIKTLFKIVNSKQDLRIKEKFYIIDLQHLLEMTAQIESRYGKDNYKGRIAKSPFQLEEDTAHHYIKIVPELKAHLEGSLGRKLKVENERDCVYNTYLVYMAKLRYHKQWLDKYSKLSNDDVEWLVYKVLWNSVKGASTYNKWKQRKIEKELDKLIKI